MLIQIKNVSVSFGDNYVLRDMDLEIENKDKMVIVGETGSGKSIMLLSILGLLPANAKKTGSIIYHDLDLMQLSRKEFNTIRGAKIAYVPQGGANSMNPLIKIGNQVVESLRLHKNVDKATGHKRAIDLLRFFNIGREETRVNHYPHTFSGGMRQRALIAMGLSANPEILLADEPTKGLDQKRITLVEKSFLQLKDKTYLCVTHDLSFAKNIGEKICVMLSSLQIEYGHVEPVMIHPLHPYTQDIIRAMPENGLQYNKTKNFFNRIANEKDACPYFHSCSKATNRCKAMPPMITLKDRKVRCWIYADS